MVCPTSTATRRKIHFKYKMSMKLKNAFKNNMFEYHFFIAVLAVIPELT